MRGDNFKDISHYVLIQLAKFYEVSVDYLQGVQANKHERLFIFLKNAFFNLFYIFITILNFKMSAPKGADLPFINTFSFIENSNYITFTIIKEK